MMREDPNRPSPLHIELPAQSGPTFSEIPRAVDSEVHVVLDSLFGSPYISLSVRARVLSYGKRQRSSWRMRGEVTIRPCEAKGIS
jgi:hypothetical protein